jgi:hypothetical protein
MTNFRLNLDVEQLEDGFALGGLTDAEGRQMRKCYFSTEKEANLAANAESLKRTGTEDAKTVKILGELDNSSTRIASVCSLLGIEQGG